MVPAFGRVTRNKAIHTTVHLLHTSQPISLKQNNALSELIASCDYNLCLNTRQQLGKKNLRIVFLERK